ncbi:FecR family protein [Echinicola shivajiensis]|uniref:FecR family protein n=1 Tax=Echinicola shivajiensis TaxID=1035916 RepID=UPI001BFC6749|nr:FecR family protein [Echinicola shivajiensis]
MEINKYWKKQVSKLFNKTISDNELRELNRWYDDINLEELQHFKIDREKRKLAAWTSIKQNTVENPQKRKAKAQLISLSSIVKIAASFLIAALIGLQFWQKEAPATVPVEQITISNKLGQVSSFTLPDSSKIWLSTGSSFTYPEKFGATREVTLEGEAFFEVHRNPNKPFLIKSGNLSTQVLGTSFNISAYPEENMEVAVFTGKVAVKESFEEGKTIYLTKNQMATWKPDSGFGQTQTFDPAEMAKWRQGILTFKNAKMDEVIQQLSRWYDIQFKLNKNTDACLYTGEFKNTSLENALNIIQYALKINYTINEKEVLIEVPNCHRQ